MAESSADRLRRFLPGAKRLLSRQHIGAPWHAILAAEDLLAEVDALEHQAEAGMAQIETMFAKAFPGGLQVLKEELERGEAQRTTLGQTLPRLIKEKEAADTQCDGGAEPAVEAGP